MSRYSHNTSISDRQHAGFEYATALIVRNKTQAVMAELTEDIIGYTVKWARVFIIKSVVVN